MYVYIRTSTLECKVHIVRLSKTDEIRKVWKSLLDMYWMRLDILFRDCFVEGMYIAHLSVSFGHRDNYWLFHYSFLFLIFE